MLKRLVLILFLVLPATASATPHFRIVKGAPIADESVPFMASLVASGYSAYDGHFCGGSVIAPDVVLTAAHCVQGESPRSISVVTGRSRLSDEGLGSRSRVDAIAVDPRYDDDGNDAALVHLVEPATVAPIGLSDDPSPFGLAAVAGWGLTTSAHPHAISDDLRAVQIPVVSNRSCGTATDGTSPRRRCCAPGATGATRATATPAVRSSAPTDGRSASCPSEDGAAARRAYRRSTRASPPSCRGSVR